MVQINSPLSAATDVRGISDGLYTLSSVTPFVKSSTSDFLKDSGASLGITVKSRNILCQDRAKLLLDRRLLDDIKKRYRLRIYSQNLLSKTGTIAYKSQYYSCRRHKVKKVVILSRSASTGKGAVRNLAHCASVWACPCCSPVIQHFRTQEIAYAVKQWFAESQDNVTYFPTLTAPHTRDQPLHYLLEKQKSALHIFWNSRFIQGSRYSKGCKEMLGYLGRITGTEITSGNPGDEKYSGWHPHQHILILGKRISEKELDDVKKRMIDAWVHALLKVGLCLDNPNAIQSATLHSLTLEQVTKAEKYISKLGNEIGESNIKSGRGNARYMPFDLLSAAESGKEWAKSAWIEYYACSKGKRQLVWSDGLKSRFRIKEHSDQELADWKAEKDFQNLFGFENWEAIRKIPGIEPALEYWIASGKEDKILKLFNELNIDLIFDKKILDDYDEKPLGE